MNSLWVRPARLFRAAQPRYTPNLVNINDPVLQFWTVRKKSRKGPGKAAYALWAEMENQQSQSNEDVKVDYRSWSHESLMQRVTQLEKELKSKTSGYSKTSQPLSKVEQQQKMENNFDVSKYHTRLIALKLSYLGKRFNGFEHHVGNKTPLPTIEEEIWKALIKAKLIFPDSTKGVAGQVNWEGCDYSKCGRTDKGVSAFGQVIGLRVRSNRPMSSAEPGAESEDVTANGQVDEDIKPKKEVKTFDPIKDEIQYAKLLNNLLPPEIRILAWCPNPPDDFSARFSCRERQYRYFFTQPAFVPVPTNLEDVSDGPSQKDGWLDVPAMQKAASYYVGEHDFRNFCKIDASKQITNFHREVFHADIEEVSDYTAGLQFVNAPELSSELSQPESGKSPRIYTFTLHGSAFLWHQVRHMVAVLFLVGQGLEKPEVIKELLNVEKYPSRPTYEMATDTPLVLWDCIFPAQGATERKDGLNWIYVGDGPGMGEQKFASPGLIVELWKVWRERKIDEMLAGSLMGVVAAQGDEIGNLDKGRTRKKGKSQKVFDGSDKPSLKGTYQEISKKPRLELADVLNERYAKKKGFESSKELRELGFRRTGGKTTEAGEVDDTSE